MPDLAPLCTAAVSIAFVHTALGPDHYLPFAAMSRVGRWSLGKTMLVTLLCGIAHVLSSVLLGAIGIAFGIVVLKLERIEEIRGDLAGWLLLTFGLVYFAWGLARALGNESHVHVYGDGTVDVHTHGANAPVPSINTGNPYVSPQADSSLSAPIDAAAQRRAMTPWVLFTIFLFGPCEPLIPMLMYPAAQGNAWGVAVVTVLFGATTVLTMLGIVLAISLGADTVRVGWLSRYSHALAGFVILACAVAMKLGL